MAFQIRERRDPALGVLVDPPVVDQPDRHRVEEVQLLAPRPALDYEPRLLQYAEVLHDAEPGHLQLGSKLAERAAVTLEEPVEQQPAGGVRQCLKHPIVVHA